MKWSIESDRPAPSATKNAKDANKPAAKAIDQDVRCTQHDAFAGAFDAPWAAGAGKSGEKGSFFVDPSFHEFCNLFTFFCDVGCQFFKIGHGGPAPDQLHALRFNFLALRIA